MGELRLDPLTGRWVLIDPLRSERPYTFTPRNAVVQADRSRPCPFCPGHESNTPPALETYGDDGQWAVRVIPNLYPAFEGDDPFLVEHRGPIFTRATSGGIHEVLVLSPDHDAGWDALAPRQAALVMAAARDRLEEHGSTPGLRYSQLIYNSGREAGASVDHPHAQLMAVPFVPKELADELGGFARFEGRCLLCTTLEIEESSGRQVVFADDRIVVVCPYWSGTPFEMLAIPRAHSPHLHRTTPQDMAATGQGIATMLARLKSRLGDVAYNIVFHSAPYSSSGPYTSFGPYHWHAHILPKLTTVAGFELGTGMLINVTAPEEAAQQLRLKVAAA